VGALSVLPAAAVFLALSFLLHGQAMCLAGLWSLLVTLIVYAVIWLVTGATTQR